MASVANETQVNFNPSWMQSVAKSDRAARMDRNRVSVTTDEELMPPVFAKNRYGREDILALIGKGTKPPNGLEKCSFFVETLQAPIILQPLSDIEDRLLNGTQQNINSSKALSSLPKSRQQLINGGASPDVQTNAGWTTISSLSSNRGGSVRSGNRWSGLGSSSGNGPGENTGYRPGRGNLMRLNSGGHNSNDPGAGNRWSGLSATGIAIHDHTSGYRPARGGSTNIGGRGTLRQISAQQSQDPETIGEDTIAPLQQPLQQMHDSSPPMSKPKQTQERKKNTTKSTSPEATSTPTTALNHFGGGQAQEPEKIVTTAAASSPNILTRTTHSTSPLKEVRALEGMGDRVRYSKEDFVKINEKTEASSVLSNFCNSHQNDLMKQEPIPTEVETKWFYLDPTDTLQGPFETKQMMLWYNNRFFKPDLRLRSNFINTFTTLGDLIHANGAEAPFVHRALPCAENIPSIPQPVFSKPSNIWGPPTSPTANQTIVNPEADKIWVSKQRQLAEEARKLKEKEVALRREEQERAEKERLMREKEIELARKQEEINRMALEREARLRREHEELVNRERQLKEFERQKMEELEREKQRIQFEMQRQQIMKEEEERRKQQEIEAMIEREKEKQRIEIETKLKREQLEKEESLRRAYEEMQEANRKKAEDEKQRRMREEDERKRRVFLEEEARKEQFEKERLRQIANERQQAKLRDEKSQTPDVDFDSSKIAPWTKIATKTDKDKAKQVKQENRTFIEIQEEELRQLQIQQQQQKELFDQQRKLMEQQLIAGVWGKPTAKSGWNMQQPSSISQIVGSSSTRQSPPVGLRNATVWDVQPPVQSTLIPPAPKSNIQPFKQAKKDEQPKTITIGKPSDEFTKWIITRVKELNSSIDAEVFATFIESVDNPDDALDYIIGYLGESKDVKGFHRDLIAKRSELRTKAHATPKDDLSKAAAAATNTTGAATKNAGGANNAIGTSNGGGSKKKKKGKSNEKVITGFTGFSSVSNNRFYAFY